MASIMIKESKIDGCIDLWNSNIPLCGSQKTELFLFGLWDEFHLFCFKGTSWRFRALWMTKVGQKKGSHFWFLCGVVQHLNSRDEKLYWYNWIGQDPTWRKISQIHPQCGNANWRKEEEVGNEQFYRNGNSHRHLQQIPQTDVQIGACFSPLLDQQFGSSLPTNLISVLKGR